LPHGHALREGALGEALPRPLLAHLVSPPALFSQHVWHMVIYGYNMDYDVMRESFFLIIQEKNTKRKKTQKEKKHKKKKTQKEKNTKRKNTKRKKHKKIECFSIHHIP
jgi:mannitol-specific phosphotransferase system IIBC component